MNTVKFKKASWLKRIWNKVSNKGKGGILFVENKTLYYKDSDENVITISGEVIK